MSHRPAIRMGRVVTGTRRLVAGPRPRALGDGPDLAAIQSAAQTSVANFFATNYGGDPQALQPACSDGSILNPFTGSCVTIASISGCPVGQFPKPDGTCAALPVNVPYGTVPLPGFPPAVPVGSVPQSNGMCPAGYGLAADRSGCYAIGTIGYPAGGSQSSSVSCDAVGYDGYCYSTACPTGSTWDPTSLTCMQPPVATPPTPNQNNPGPTTQPAQPPATTPATTNALAAPAATMSTGAKVAIGVAVAGGLGLGLVLYLVSQSRKPSRIVRQ